MLYWCTGTHTDAATQEVEVAASRGVVLEIASVAALIAPGLASAKAAEADLNPAAAEAELNPAAEAGFS